MVEMLQLAAATIQLIQGEEKQGRILDDWLSSFSSSERWTMIHGWHGYLYHGWHG